MLLFRQPPPKALYTAIHGGYCMWKTVWKLAPLPIPSLFTSLKKTNQLLAFTVPPEYAINTMGLMRVNKPFSTTPGI